MSGRRVVVTQRLFDERAVACLEEGGCTVDLVELPDGQSDGALAPAELASMLDGAAGWIVGHAHVTRELQAALPQLQIISRRGVGYERVDVDAARDLGKVVCIAAGANDASVADHAMALMLAVGHRLRETQQNMIAGNWAILPGSDLYRRTVGIVGLGRIGQSLVQRLQGFEVEILATTTSRRDRFAETHGVALVPLDELLRRSDYVSLHAPLNETTRYMIDEAALARMQPHGILINTARGGLVDDLALLRALEHGIIAGAGLDVFMSENDLASRATTQALIEQPNVIATPHAAASTREGLARTNLVAAESVVAVLNGMDPPADRLIVDGRREAP